MRDKCVVLGLDIDNVLNNCAELFLEQIWLRFGVPFDLGSKDTYTFTEHVSLEQEAQILNDAHQAIFRRFSPRKIAVEFLQHMHAVVNADQPRVRFIYITDRRFKGFPRQDLLSLPSEQLTYSLTYDWLLRHGFPVTKLFLEGDQGRSKGEIAHDEGVDIFIEDAPQKARNIADKLIHSSDSLLDPVWLLLMPWNRKEFLSETNQEIMYNGIRYVKDWPEIARLLATSLSQWDTRLTAPQIKALKAYAACMF